jgi:predicted nucleic acid-binding protein
MIYFYYSYAVVEYLNNNPKFAAYFESNTGFLTVMNVMEVYYSSLLDAEIEKANVVIDKLWQLIVHPSKDTIKRAMQFRLKHKKRKLSCADCIGYVSALDSRVKFLTGARNLRNSRMLSLSDKKTKGLYRKFTIRWWLID